MTRGVTGGHRDSGVGQLGGDSGGDKIGGVRVVLGGKVDTRGSDGGKGGGGVGEHQCQWGGRDCTGGVTGGDRGMSQGIRGQWGGRGGVTHKAELQLVTEGVELLQALVKALQGPVGTLPVGGSTVTATPGELGNTGKGLGGLQGGMGGSGGGIGGCWDGAGGHGDGIGGYWGVTGGYWDGTGGSWGRTGGTGVRLGQD